MKITKSQLRKIIAEEIKEGFLDRLRGGEDSPITYPAPGDKIRRGSDAVNTMNLQLAMEALDDILAHVGDSAFVEDRVRFVKEFIQRGLR